MKFCVSKMGFENLRAFTVYVLYEGFVRKYVAPSVTVTWLVLRYFVVFFSSCR